MMVLWVIRLWIDIYKARISADIIGRYIGADKSISAYPLLVKFHRYANPTHESQSCAICCFRIWCFHFGHSLCFAFSPPGDADHRFAWFPDLRNDVSISDWSQSTAWPTSQPAARPITQPIWRWYVNQSICLPLLVRKLTQFLNQSMKPMYF